MSEKSVVLRVDYDEYQPGTYRGILVEGKHCQHERVNTGDFEADVFSATEKYLKQGYKVFKSSTVDHYRNDLEKVPSPPTGAPSESLKGIIDAELLATEAAGIVYKQMKAKMFDLLESQLCNIPHHEGEKIIEPKLSACKRIAESMITETSKNVKRYIVSMLGDWADTFECGGRLSPEEEEKALKEHDELRKKLG